MILVDTHIWVWWATNSDDLPEVHRKSIEAHRQQGIGVSAISCWEVAKLVEYGRLEFTLNLDVWMDAALRLPDVQLIELTPRIAIASTQLPEGFHRDPADQIIVATARVHDMQLVTADRRIRRYDHVQVL